MSLSLCFHVVGIVMWVGGVMMITRILSAVSSAERGETAAALISVIARVWKMFVLPGMVLVVLTGLYQLSLGGLKYYFAQGWFHGKVTVVIAALVATVITHHQVTTIGSGAPGNRARLMMCHGIMGLALLGGVFLTILGR